MALVEKRQNLAELCGHCYGTSKLPLDCGKLPSYNGKLPLHNQRIVYNFKRRRYSSSFLSLALDSYL